MFFDSFVTDTDFIIKNKLLFAEGKDLEHKATINIGSSRNYLTTIIGSTAASTN